MERLDPRSYLGNAIEAAGPSFHAVLIESSSS